MYRNVRLLCSSWAQITYKENFDYLFEKRNVPDLIRIYTTTALTKLNIYNEKMTGFTVAKHGRNQKVEDLGTINGVGFTDIYHKCINSYDFSPALYILEIIILLKKNKVSHVDSIGWLQRALRTFPSFLRETDCAVQLLHILEEYDPNVLINMSPEQDRKEHTDILLNYKNNQFHIWSYSVTTIALNNLRKRLLVEDKIPAGIHVLLPANIYDKNKRDNIGEWWFVKKYLINDFCHYLDNVNSNINHIPNYTDLNSWLNDNDKPSILESRFKEWQVFFKWPF